MFRLDAEYFQKRYLENDKTLKKFNWKFLESTVESIKSFGAYSLTNEISYLDEGIPFLRGQNIKNGAVDFSNALFIDRKANALLWKSEVTPRMVLLTMSGSVGASSVALESWNYPVNSNQDIAKITTTSEVNPFFLSALLESKYGKLQMERLPVGSVQQHTFIWQLEKLVIPLLTKTFQNKIEETVNKSHAKLEESKALYAEAENLLLDELGLRDWSPSDEGIAYKTISDVFDFSGRFDAEFYQIKYDEAIAALTKGKWETLGSLAKLQKGTQARSEEHGTIPYASIKDVKNYSIETEENTDIKESVLVNPKDLVLAITGATIGKTGINDKQSAIAISGDLVGIAPHSIASEYVLIVLASKPIQLLCERYTTGATNGHLAVSDVAGFPIPLIEDSKQNSIVEAVKTAYFVRLQSKRLLEIAKRAVELAIEDSEAAAIGWIDTNLIMKL